MELHERIALARKQAALSQEQLGEKLGVSRQAVSKWESGQTNPDVSYIAEMCRLFGVSSDWLLFGEAQAQFSAPARCPGCQAIVTGLDKYCPNCGRNLSAPAEPTYAMVLRNGAYIARAPAVVAALSVTGLFPAGSPLSQPVAEKSVNIDHIPFLMARGLTHKQIEQIQEKINAIDCYSSHLFAFYPDDDGASPEELLKKIPVATGGPPPKPSEPLSFGMTVLAVAVAVVLGILIVGLL